VAISSVPVGYIGTQEEAAFQFLVTYLMISPWLPN